MSNPILDENANGGTTAWQLSKLQTGQIQCYCDKTSYNAGDTVSFFVSTQVAATAYSVSIYRMGWYQGKGACLKSSVTGRSGVAQGYWDGSVLQSCPTQIFNSTTHNLEAGWAVTDTWAIPASACTGVYIAQFTDVNGFQHYCTFVVKGNSSADYVVVTSDTTSAAYNSWGGYSLYTNLTVDVQVSFNKPNTQGFGTGNLFRFDVAFIKWAERQGFNLSYLSDIDVHTNSAQLLNYKAALMLGHDEYWTRERRDGTESALASGVGLAFLGANACYWQCRLGNDNAGNANRTATCYKVKPNDNNLALDPLYGSDNTRVTTQSRLAPLSNPENKLIGIMYSSFVNTNSNVAWTVDAAANASYLTGTGLVDGSSYGYDLVGYEFDKQQSGGPSNLQIIGTTPITDYQSVSDHSNTTVYIAASGAPVFATGSISWTWGLDTYRYSTQPGGTPAEIAGMQALMVNVMWALIRARNPGKWAGFLIHL